ncbi:MAG: hypothetical protein AB8G22_27470 [Saprospiraceae bacterium]
MSTTTQYLKLEEELKPYREILGKAADTVVTQDVSNYPIFVVHQQVMDMGIPIIEQDGRKKKWSVNVSSLEEFVTKQIIQPERVDNFKEAYKDPEVSLCLFVLSELGANFIFIAR